MKRDEWMSVALSVCVCLFVGGVAGCSDDDPVSDAGVAADAGADAGGDAASDDGGATLGWQLLGDQVSSATAESEDPVMLEIDSMPAVGYRHASFRVHFHVWDGVWSATAVDPTGANAVASIHRAPDMCSSGDAVYMAYAAAGSGTADDGAFYDRVFVHRWTSLAGWAIQNGGEEISEPWNSVSEIGYDADEAAIACRAAGLPAVAWTEIDAIAQQDADVFTTLLAGGSRSPRIDRDTSGVTGTGARTTEVAVASDGTMYVAHFEDTGSSTDLSTQLFVTRYSGGTLQTLGDAVDIDFDSNTLAPPSLALHGGDIYLAWAADRNDSGSRELYVARWDGATWALLGGEPLSALGATQVDANSPDLIVRNGVPTVAWAEADDDGQYIFVAEYREGTWNLIGNRINVDLQRVAADPSIADVGGTLHVAFEEAVDGFPQIFVKRRL